MLDDASRGAIVNARQGPEIIGRGPIDIDGALLPDSFSNTLGYGLGIPSGHRGRVGGLLADLIWAAIVRGAAGKADEEQRNECEKPHTLD